MKKRLRAGMIFVVLPMLSVLVGATSAFSWNQSFHARVAKKCLGLDYRYIANYNARMGSIVPDFFWYLRDAGLITGPTSAMLHGETERPCVSPATTYFFDTATGLLNFWNYRLIYFAKGMRSHVYADVVAHNTDYGFLDGPNKWVQKLHEMTGEPDLEILHLAAEFAADALLIKKYGLHINDLLFSEGQANFVEEAVVEALGDVPDFDVSEEFKKYLALMRALEKLAALYAPYLIRGAVDGGALSMLEGSELLDLGPELSEEGLNRYLKVLLVLLVYPAEIYETITADGMHWEYDALGDAIEFCRHPVGCEPE